MQDCSISITNSPLVKESEVFEFHQYGDMGKISDVFKLNQDVYYYSVSKGITIGKQPLVYLMAWCRQATMNNLN